MMSLSQWGEGNGQGCKEGFAERIFVFKDTGNRDIKANRKSFKIPSQGHTSQFLIQEKSHGYKYRKDSLRELEKYFPGDLKNLFIKLIGGNIGPHENIGFLYRFLC